MGTESEVIYLPNTQTSPQNSNSSCSLGKVYLASFLGALSAVVLATIVSFVLAGTLGAVVAKKLGEGAGKSIPVQMPVKTENGEDVNWEDYFDNSENSEGASAPTGGNSSNEEKYVNPFENL